MIPVRYIKTLYKAEDGYEDINGWHLIFKCQHPNVTVEFSHTDNDVDVYCRDCDNTDLTDTQYNRFQEEFDDDEGDAYVDAD